MAAPVVTAGNFSIVLPLITGQAVGTMVATNSPTAWSFTAGNVGGFYAINNSGAITVTAAGAAGLTVGSEVLTVQACNGAPATWDPTTVQNVTLSNGNLTAQATSSSAGVRMSSALAQTTGKYYIEIDWAQLGGFINGGNFGIAATTATYFNALNHTAGVTAVNLTQGDFSFAGKIWSDGTYSGFHLGGSGLGGPFLVSGTTVGLAIDLDNRAAWLKLVSVPSPTSSNLGNFWNGSATSTPVGNANGVTIGAGAVTPIGVWNTNLDIYIANFSGPFIFGVPSGFGVWNTTLDPATVQSATLSNANLTVTNTGTTSFAQGALGLASAPKSTGKYYFEVTLNTAATVPNSSHFAIGVIESTGSLATRDAVVSQVLMENGNIFVQGTAFHSLNHIGASGDIYAFAVDLDNGKFWTKLIYGTAGAILWNGDFATGGTVGNPATNVGGAGLPPGPLLPFIGFGGTGQSSNNVLTANFAGPFVGDIPAGFVPWPSTLECGTAPATINVVTSAPVVNSTSFTDFLPVSTTEFVGTVTASNFPTSWSIIAGDPSGFYTIDNNGAITITSAGDAGIVAGIVTLTVRASNAGGSGTGSVQITTVAEAVAQYRLLVPHYLASGYTAAGTTVTEGVEIPSGWVPTIAVEPLNITAIHNYWNAGPPAGAEYGEDFFIFPVAQKPSVYWQPLGPLGYFQLTGAGATFGARTSG